jgi:hypothetical protein
MTYDIEFLLFLSKTILQLCVLGAVALSAAFSVAFIFWLFGGCE